MGTNEEVEGFEVAMDDRRIEAVEGCNTRDSLDGKP